ncbi:MAG: M6 family metalloprotease domain-containing protein [Nitrospirae bacterium]|nr:M6 family metalloprotease domain-containing protein [Nitrospirota bacterium]
MNIIDKNSTLLRRFVMFTSLNGRKRWFVLLISLCLLPGFSTLALAVQANNEVSELAQPDGSIIMGSLRGDEWSNWMETTEGYTIAKSGDGYWYYVTAYDASNQPVLSAIRVVEKPSGLITNKHVQPSRTKMLMERDLLHAENEFERMAVSPKATFSGKVLFILVQFNNRKGTYTEAEFANLLTNNIKDYYSKASNGKVTISPANESFAAANNGVVGWLTLNYNHPNTGGNISAINQKIVYDAIVAADPYVDFASYDTNHDGYVDSSELAVVVIVAGYETSYSTSYTPSVWGHQWSIAIPPKMDGVYVGAYHAGAGGYAQFGEIHQSSATNMHLATMGIMAHELGHLIFGLPDLYDTDGSSVGIGPFCLMASGSWGKTATDIYSGATPVLPSAWVRSSLNWISSYIASGNSSLTAIGDTSANAYNTVYKAKTSLSNEYFLVENRQPLGYDKGLERWLGTGFGGLAIFHIDEAIAANSNDTHRKVDLVEADATEGKTYATDLWYSGNAATFNNTSTPNSKLYNGADSNVSITSISAKGTNMTAQTSEASAQVYTISTSVNGVGGSISCTPTSITSGGKVTCTIKANTGYSLSTLTDNSVSVKSSVSNNTYTISNVTANHTIIASFSQITYTVSASVSGVGGSISCTPTSVAYGSKVTCTIKANTGYTLSTLTDNSVSVKSSVINNTYIISNVTANHKVLATFKK